MPIENNTPHDRRISRSMWFTDKIGRDTAETIPQVDIVLGEKMVSFLKPNTVSLSLNISKRELIRAKEIFENQIKTSMFDPIKFRTKKKDLSDLYDYFEAIQSSLIFSYNSIESFCNISIPNNYVYKKKNARGILEHWTKKDVERWMSTEQKLTEVVPDIIKCEPPNKLDFWKTFLKLQELRNNVIHPKTTEVPYKDVQSHYEEYLKEIIFEIIQSGYKIIKHFCDLDIANPLYPAEFWDGIKRIIQLESFGQLFEQPK